jgi:hypothetical protein
MEYLSRSSRLFLKVKLEVQAKVSKNVSIFLFLFWLKQKILFNNYYVFLFYLLTELFFYFPLCHLSFSDLFAFKIMYRMEKLNRFFDYKSNKLSINYLLTYNSLS